MTEVNRSTLTDQFLHVVIFVVTIQLFYFSFLSPEQQVCIYANDEECVLWWCAKANAKVCGNRLHDSDNTEATSLCIMLLEQRVVVVGKG